MLNTVAQMIARHLAQRGTQRAYGLVGSHIKPIWAALEQLGATIVDARAEGAAVHMAHAAAEVTGRLGVAVVTAGPGMTNAVSAIATASHAGVPLLVLSALPPSPQLGRGAFEEIPQRDVIAPLCRMAATIWRPDQVLDVMDAATEAATGPRPGPVYVDVPVDVLRSPVPADLPDRPAPVLRAAAVPHPDAVADAARRIAAARRPLVVSGAGAREAGDALHALVDQVGGVYLDTRESRGLLPLDNPAAVPAQRGRAMAEADLVITVGRRLDYELAYGSPAVFAEGARFVRIGLADGHLRDNRPGDAEVHGDVALALTAITEDLRAEAGGGRRAGLDEAWVADLRTRNAERVARLQADLSTTPPGADGRMHPNRLLAAVNEVLDDDTVVVADGGDILSFAAVALRARRLLTPGPFGCLGVGVPFAIAAAIEEPDRRVIALVGDGAFGFSAMELHTAVRHGARIVVVVANNEAWGIEDRDRIKRYPDARFGTRLPGCRYDELARALGAHGERVEDPDDLPGALARAMAAAPAVVDVAVTLDAESPDHRNGLAELPDHQALRSWDELERERRADG